MKKIVLTGGPGAGKTTSLEYIKSKLETHGYKIFIVPEVATMLFNSGVDLHTENNDTLIELQSEMLSCQEVLEDSIEHVAETTNKECVIICDRGKMDVKAFMPEEIWYKMIDAHNYSESELRDTGYDGIIHLMTPSDKYYTIENNPARKETGEQAREIDEKIKDAWIGHPHLRVIDSRSDFKEKMRKALEAIYRIVGIPKPLEIERKYLVTSYDKIPVKCVDAYIQQSYLEDGSRIRLRTQDSVTMYTRTMKSDISDVTRTEVEDKISGGEYRILANSNSVRGKEIIKLRRSFLWQNQYFELDQFITPTGNLILLEIELESEDQEITLPPFINIDREVTNEKRYSNAFIAGVNR